MSDHERIMLECRYILSLDKDYKDLANILNINIDIVIDDLNNKLPNIDSKLYHRVNKVLKMKNCS